MFSRKPDERTTGPRVAVITPERVFYADRRSVAMPGRVTDLARLLAAAASMARPHCVVVLDGVTPDELHVSNVDPWRYSKLDTWTLFYLPDGRTASVGFRDRMSTRHFGPLFDAATPPALLAQRLDSYHMWLGVSWRGTHATTALAGIRLSWENAGKTPLWQHERIPGMSAVGPLNYRRALSGWELRQESVHTFDATAAYLGSMINASLAWSEIEHTGRVSFDQGKPGYWLIELGPLMRSWHEDAARPPLVHPARIRDGRVWVTTPIAALLREWEPFGVHDSWLGRGHPIRLLRSWAETVRDARAAPGLRGAVKRTYKDAVGGMQRPGMRIHRPDWAHTVIDLWRATLLRRVWRVYQHTGIWPARVATDSISYVGLGLDTLGELLGGSCDVPGCGCRLTIDTPPLGSYTHESSAPVSLWAASTPLRPQRTEVRV